MTDSLDTPVIVLKRWTRYGHDRVYASLGETQLGHRDLHTGAVVCDDDAQRATVEHATEQLWQQVSSTRYQPRHASAPVTTPAPRSVVAPVAARPTTTALPPAPAAAALLPDRDLTANKPGAAVFAQAKALRDAAPVRTRVARVLGQRTEERNWRIGATRSRSTATRSTTSATAATRQPAPPRC